MLTHILRRGFNTVIIAIMLSPLIRSAIPMTASVAPSEAGIYTEDFSTYANKDHTNQAEWDIWTHSANLDLLDAYYYTNPNVDSNGGYTIAVWDNAGYATGGNPSEIFAQRLDIDGNRLWATNVRANVTPGIASHPSVAVDTNGVAVVVWEDVRNGNRDIYAQRLNAAGSRTWAADIRINSDTGTSDQRYPVVAVDDSGNVIVVWSDCRNDNWDIYAQRLNANGGKLWAADVRVSSDAGNIDPYETVVGIADTGIAYAAWSDDRSGTMSIYAQKLSAVGTKLWLNDAQVANGYIDDMAIDNFGQPVIVWGDWNNIYAQKMDVSGNRLWGSNVRVNAGDGPKYNPAISIDNSGNIAVVWLEGYFRIARNINAQRLDQNGIRLWSTDSHVVADNAYADGGQPDVAIIDAAGSALVMWRRDSIYAQLVEPDGDKAWSAEARVAYRSGTVTQIAPQTVTSSNDTTIVVWDNDLDICAQRLDKVGSKLWSAPVRVNSDTAATHHWPYSVVADGLGGVTVVWADNRSGNDDIYIQQLDANGNKAWATDVRVNSDTSTVSHHSPAVAIDTGGGMIVVWEHQSDIYAQRLDTAGNKAWIDDVRINSTIGTVRGYRIAADSSGGLAVVWEDTRNGDLDIYAQRLNGSGDRILAADVRVNSDNTAAGQDSPAFALDGSGAMFIIWGEDSFDIYAQRLSFAGSKLWATDVRVNSSMGTVSPMAGSVIAMDTGTTAVIVWSDERNGNNTDIYGQRLDINANKLWGTDVRVDSDPGSADQYLEGVWGNDGVILVTWDDRRNGGSNQDLYAQSLNANGSKLWTSDVRVNSDIGPDSSQGDSTVSWGFGGEVFMAWTDRRNANSDVYMQRLNSVGGKAWLSDLQVVNPDQFYFPTGLVQSRTIDTIAGDIRQATLTANYQLNGGSTEFALSNNGGTNWVTATLGAATVFTTTSSDLRWKAVLTGDPVWRNRSPIVTSLRIEYSTAVPYADDYEADDTCAQAKPIATGGAAQAHTFHQLADADWAWFDVITNTTYVVQATHTGTNADLELALYDTCQHVVQNGDPSLGNDARLVLEGLPAGRYYLKVTNTDPNIFGVDTGYALSVRLERPNGLAVIVAGRLKMSDALQANINTVANRAYLTFLQRGYSKQNIYYLNTQINQDVDDNGLNDDVDGTPLVVNVREAIQSWARQRGVALGVPLYVYMVDHGEVDRFHADLGQQVTAELLNLWLSNLEATTGADQITVILEACYSGSFVDQYQAFGYGAAEIAGPNRVIVSSTSSWANAFPLGDGVLFSDAFWGAMREGRSVRASFQQGQAAVQAAGNVNCAYPNAFCQQPWLDDNGNGVPNETTDGALAQARGLPATLGWEVPEVAALAVNVPTAGGVGSIQAEVYDNGTLSTVEAMIIPPDYQPVDPGDGSLPTWHVPTVTLTTAGANLFAGQFSFTQRGFYRVVAYARDGQHNQSAPRSTTVCVNCSFVYLPLVRK